MPKAAIAEFWRDYLRDHRGVVAAARGEGWYVPGDDLKGHRSARKDIAYNAQPTLAEYGLVIRPARDGYMLLAGVDTPPVSACPTVRTIEASPQLRQFATMLLPGEGGHLALAEQAGLIRWAIGSDVVLHQVPAGRVSLTGSGRFRHGDAAFDVSGCQTEIDHLLVSADPQVAVAVEGKAATGMPACRQLATQRHFLRSRFPDADHHSVLVQVVGLGDYIVSSYQYDDVDLTYPTLVRQCRFRLEGIADPDLTLRPVPRSDTSAIPKWVPQADSVEDIVRVALGEPTAVVDRQVEYYQAAAATLGLVGLDGRLTTVGRQFHGLPQAARRRRLAGLLRDCEFVQMFRQHGPATFERATRKLPVIGGGSVKLAASTADRRRRSVAAWCRWLDAHDDARDGRTSS